MKKTLAQKIKIGLYSFVGIVAVIIAALMIKARMEISHLLENGVRVKGVITQKSEQTSTSRKGVKSRYAFDLNLFVDTSSPKAGQPKPQSFDEKMDAMLAASKARMQNQFRDVYAKVAIGVSGDSFKKHSIGQVVDVVHLKGEPGTARLLEDIE